MAKYRKNPVIIEAEQITEDLVDKPPEGMSNYSGDNSDLRRGLFIPTLEGKMFGAIGDWLITGVKGEQYPCKDDIFKATYEPVYPSEENLQRAELSKEG